MSSAISLEQVDKAYRSGSDPERMVLHNINLQIRKGELLALVGPSGCGKSTLLNLIAGLDHASRGQVRFDKTAADMVLSVVFQQPRLLDWLSAKDNISLVLEGHKKPASERERLVESVLRKVELTDHGDMYPQRLSGGQRQRVAIARAFAVAPDVLLLDEPFSALDELTARRLRQLLQSLWLDDTRPRPTGVLVTHNMLEAAFLADRIAVLGGTPASVLDIVEVDLPRPRHPDDPGLFECHRKVMSLLGH